MLSETELRAQYANLQQRALHIGARGPSRICQLAAAMQSPPTGHADEHARVLKGAADGAMLAVQRYHNAVPFLETAGSLIESLVNPPDFSEDTEWHDGLLCRLAEVLETAADLIAEGEACLERSSQDRIQS